MVTAISKGSAANSKTPKPNLTSLTPTVYSLEAKGEGVRA